MATERYTMAVVLRSIEVGNGDQFAMIVWISSMVTWPVNKWATSGKTYYRFVSNYILLYDHLKSYYLREVIEDMILSWSLHHERVHI